MKTAVIYARYSCDAQTEQSIEGQLRECQKYAKAHDILILETYIDRAMSGTNDNRFDFQRMLKDSEKRQWDYVIVYKLDRFSRNKYESVVHKKTLKDNGVKLLSAMEQIPDTPEGTLMEALLEGFNQYYSEELAQKLDRACADGGSLCLIIGSSHGIAPEVKAACDLRLSVSKLTFPHQMMRVLLLEVLYRCFGILRGTKYHK